MLYDMDIQFHATNIIGDWHFCIFWVDADQGFNELCKLVACGYVIDGVRITPSKK